MQAVNKLPSARPSRLPARRSGSAPYLPAWPACACACAWAWLAPAAGACLALAGSPAAWADPRPVVPVAISMAGLPDALAADVTRLVLGAAALVWGESAQPPRIEVQVGKLDPRLRVAPCAQVLPYLPAGSRPIGRTRIGLRCAQGPSAWNISLPVTVKVWAPALVATTALPIGTLLSARHLALAEVDLAERSDPALLLPEAAVGRTLARGLAPGEALRRDDLKLQQWFKAGDTVRIMAQGPGYAISSEGLALGPGLDGQATRVRIEGGRIVTGVAAGDRRVDLSL